MPSKASIAKHQAAELALSELEARAVAARDGDLAAYAFAVHGRRYEPHQEVWAEALESETRLVIVCPPDSFKSTTVRDWVERAIGQNRDVRILWLMNSGVQAQKQVMMVAQTIVGNPIYRRAFGVEPDEEGQWTKEVLYVRRDLRSPDPTLMATGLNGPYQGLHFDVIIVDDPTNPEDVRSPTEMELQRNKLRGVVLDRLVEGGRIVAILTRWGPNDLVPTFQEMGFTVVQMPAEAEYPWGPTISPTRFPPEKLARIRRDKGEGLYALTYLCDPQVVAGGQVVKLSDFRYWGPEDVPEALDVFMGVDPAASTKSYADYSAIATVGVDRSGRMFVLDVWAGKVGVPALREEIVRRATRTAGLRAVGIETAGFQLGIVQDLRRAYRLPLVEIPYRSRRSALHRTLGLDRDKLSRLLYLHALMTSGRLFFARGLPVVDGVSLEQELVQAPRGKHDDRIDALAFACILAEAGRPRVGLVSVLPGW